MTNIEIILLASLWIFLGVFICLKTKWFENTRRVNGEVDAQVLSIFTIILAPLVFIWFFCKRMFIEEWGDNIN